MSYRSGYISYLQIYAPSEFVNPLGGSEIDINDLPIEERTVTHVPPAVGGSCVLPEITTTGEEMTVLLHVPSTVIIGAAQVVLAGNDITIHLDTPNIQAAVTGQIVFTDDFVVHVPPDVSIVSIVSVVIADIVVHVLPVVSITDAGFVLTGNDVMISFDAPAISVSTPVNNVRTATAPTWFIGELVANVPPDIVIGLSGMLALQFEAIIEAVAPVLAVQPSSFKMLDGDWVPFSTLNISISSPAIYARELTAFEIFLETMPVDYPAVVLYRCYLTGITDLYLPMSSFQSRIRNGEPTYLEVVIPNALDYIDEISTRSTGDIVVEKGLMYPGGTSDYLELVRVDFESAPYDLGATNQTIRLSGHKTVTNTAPKVVTLRNVSGVSLQTDGKRRVRCAVDFLARAGDTVTWDNGSDSMVAGMLTLIVSVSQQIMDITEA